MALFNKRVLSKIGAVTLATILVANQGSAVFASSKDKKDSLTITHNPGHGGSDGGHSGSGLVERDVCIDLSAGFNKALNLFAIKNATANDPGNNLNQRVNFAKEMESLNVEIHNNGVDFKSANGFEIFVQDKSNPGFINVLTSFGSSFSNIIGFTNRGIKVDSESARGKLAATYSSDSSIGILLEVGFLSNPSDASKLDTKEKRTIVGFILAGELLVALGAISKEDAKTEYKNLAIELNLLSNNESTSQSTEETNPSNSTHSKDGVSNSSTNQSIDELVAQMRDNIDKTNAETAEIQSRINLFNKKQTSDDPVKANLLQLASDLNGSSNNSKPTTPEDNTSTDSKPTTPEDNTSNDSKPVTPEDNTSNDSKPVTPEDNTSNDSKPTTPEDNTSNDSKPTTPEDNTSNDSKPVTPEDNADNNTSDVSENLSNLSNSVNNTESNNTEEPKINSEDTIASRLQKVKDDYSEKQNSETLTPNTHTPIPGSKEDSDSDSDEDEE